VRNLRRRARCCLVGPVRVERAGEDRRAAALTRYRRASELPLFVFIRTIRNEACSPLFLAHREMTASNRTGQRSRAIPSRRAPCSPTSRPVRIERQWQPISQPADAARQYAHT
jgi:hypothetical protein